MASWAEHVIKQLALGQTAQCRPRGNSMQGKIESGNLVTIEPFKDRTLKVGDIVLVRVRGMDYLHLITAIDGERYQIGNNKGRTNGWVRREAIYGIAVRIEA